MSKHIYSRRNFLRLTAATTGGLLVAACTTAAPASQSDTSTGQTAPAGEKPVVRWQDWPDWEPDMEQMMALLAENLPNLTVEFEPLGEDFEDKTLTMMVAGTAPDVMTGWGPIFRKWSEKGQLMDLQPQVDLTYSADQIEDFHPWQWDGMVAPDTRIRFAMPYYVNVVMLLYNKDAFDEAGVAYPDAEMDHSGYAEMLRAMTKLDGERISRWGGFIQAWDYDRFQFHIQAFGGHVVNPDDWTECWLDRPEAQEALEWMRARMWDDMAIAQPLQIETTSEAQMWPSGLVATQEGGMGNLAHYANNATFNWAITHLPKGPARRSTIGTTDGWAIYKGTPQPDASWELVQFLTGDIFQNFMIDAWGTIPNRRSLLVSWKDKTIASFPVLENANLDAVNEALQEGYPMLTEEFKNQSESQTLLDAALQKVFQVGDTPVSYFTEVAQQITQVNREA